MLLNLVKTLLIATLFINATAFAQTENKKSAFKYPLLVTTEWLKLHLDEANLVIIDTRDSPQYQQLHIQNAVSIPVASTYENQEHHNKIAPISIIQSLLGNAGIESDSHLILYDDNGMLDAAREFWVLEVYGHQYVSILNGGFKSWLNAAYPSNNKINLRPHKDYIPTVIPGKLSTKFSTRLAIDDKSKIILDARSENEYTGELTRFERAGHIPSAINIPATMNIQIGKDGSNQIIPKAELRSLYGKLDKSKKIITYCNKGKESALTYFVLRRLGFNVSAYDGSWYEWNSDLNLPVEISDRNSRKKDHAHF